MNKPVSELTQATVVDLPHIQQSLIGAQLCLLTTNIKKTMHNM